jgi:type VI secretion system protein VasG
LTADPRALLKKLDATCTKALEAGASACIASRHYEVTVEHVLLALLDDRESDLVQILEHYRLDAAGMRASIQRYLSELRSGNAGKPVFSALLLEWAQDAWVHASTELGEPAVRSGSLFYRLVSTPNRYTPLELPILDKIAKDDLRQNLAVITSGSKEAARILPEPGTAAAGGGAATAAAMGKADSALARFCTDLTARARAGELDPVFGREAEIRQVVDILVRRRKNNPMIVGEPGVGKTALVEGLALRIAEGTVPDQLKNVSIQVLDLAALQAGAGVKGEFENRVRSVLNEVKASPKPVVLFIDEAHTMIGAGGSQGGGDAANLLKPALARGELRTIAATTWAEFKKYFEKDAALERRFQPVKVDEPSIEMATLMLRGVAKRFEESHGIVIQDEAVQAAVNLSSRYISGRQLPDKAVDLLDTAAARVKVQRAAPPAALEDAKAQHAGVVRELEAYDRDEKNGIDVDPEARERATARKAALEDTVASLTGRREAQGAIIAKIDALRLEVQGGAKEKRDALRAAIEELRAVPAVDRVVSADVDETLVAAVVGDWTGIPIGKMVADDVKAILELESKLKERVRGQDQGLALVARELRAAKSGLKPTTAPLGVFLLVGPSGVGKTETALGIADLIFGGERFMCTINMSEFQERHTVSRLIGSPPGYVGYGEGGVLSEAVRQRPYSVVLLDEVEKADKEVLNLFYQVFDKGQLNDGEGRAIDFRNTVVILTSNLATDLITQAAPPGEPPAPLEELTSMVKPTLSAWFKPALLARMTVVPYIPIGPDALKDIAKMKLGGVAKRTKASHDVDLVFDDAVTEAIAARCREVESGARNVDHILRGTIMPFVSNELLDAMARGVELASIKLEVKDGGDIIATATPATA